jgi:hypothetical protein
VGRGSRFRLIVVDNLRIAFRIAQFHIDRFAVAARSERSQVTRRDGLKGTDPFQPALNALSRALTRSLVCSLICSPCLAVKPRDP